MLFNHHKFNFISFSSSMSSINTNVYYSPSLDIINPSENVLDLGITQHDSYLGDTLDGYGGGDLANTARIQNGWMKFREPLPFLTSRAPPLEMKGRVYASCVRSSMTYGSETRPLLVDVGLKFERAEIRMIRWMCGISLKNRRTNEELRRLVGVEPITMFLTVVLPSLETVLLTST